MIPESTPTEAVLAVIPALEAGDSVAAVVAGAREHLSTVLVVDDGSSDDTAARAEAAGATVLRHERNRGKGAALMTGFRWAIERGHTHAVTLDADGQHLAYEIPTLLAESASRPDALIVGARRFEKVEVSELNRFGNRFADRWIARAAGRSFPDSQSGFRVYPIAGVLALSPTREHFDFESEVLIRAARAGLEVESPEVDVHYPPPDERHSHYALWTDTVRIIRMVVSFVYFGER